MNDTDSSEIGDGIYDPRAVANLILDVIHKPPTNLSLQKLLYFVHGAYLLRNRKALVTGYFEAWTHGPVHPAVYAAFKDCEEKPNPDYADVELEIFKFGQGAERPIRVVAEEWRWLFSYDQLEEMIRETQLLWFEVLAGRQEETRKRGGETGPLL